MNITKDFKTILIALMDQINTMKYFPTQKNSTKPLEPTIVVPDNRRDPPLDGGHSTKVVGIWTMKHDISPPKFYKLLIKKELK